MTESRETETDYQTLDDVEPSTHEELQSFLADHDDATAFRVEYVDDDEDRDRLVATLQLVERTVRRPAAAIAYRCTPFEPDGEEWTVRFDRLDRVAALEPPDDVIGIDRNGTATRVGAALNLARVAPEQIDVAGLVATLRGVDADTRESGLSALRAAVKARPETASIAVPLLRDLLAAEANRPKVLEVLAAIADDRPGEIAHFVGEITPSLDAEDDACRAAAAECVSHVAAHDPVDVVDAVPALATLVEDRAEGVGHALFGLNRIAADYPGEVRPAASALTDALGDESLSVSQRLNATAALGRVAGEYPDAGVAAVDELADLLDADDHRLRANAAGVLGDVAVVHAGVLGRHVEALAALLESDDDYTLVNTTAGLSRVAEVDPDTVRPYTDRFVALLDHEHDLVRLNACWALGYLEAEAGRDRLDEVRVDDDAERVRSRAAWAIAEIEGW